MMSTAHEQGGPKIERDDLFEPAALPNCIGLPHFWIRLMVIAGCGEGPKAYLPRIGDPKRSLLFA